MGLSDYKRNINYSCDDVISYETTNQSNTVSLMSVSYSGLNTKFFWDLYYLFKIFVNKNERRYTM